MAYGSGLPRAVVQRSLADWPVVLAAWLLLVCATALVATGVIYGDAVAVGGLHRSLLAAPPERRAMEVDLLTDRAAIDALEIAIRPEMERAMAASGGDVVRLLRSRTYTEAASAAAAPDQTLFVSIAGIEDRARLVAGSWAQAGHDPIQATVSDAAATRMGLTAGTTMDLVNRLDPTVRISVTIVGIFAMDPADAMYGGDPLLTTGAATSGSSTTRGPLVIREADLVELDPGQARIEVVWLGLPDLARLPLDGIAPLASGAAGLAGRLASMVPSATSPRISTGLPDLLERVGRSVFVSRSGLILLTIQLAALAAYAVVLVAALLVERRRGEAALLRSRGASSVHLLLMAVVEAAILAVSAAALAPFLALGVVALLDAIGPTAGLGLAGSATIGIAAIVATTISSLGCVVALALPTVAASASPALARSGEARSARTSLAERLGLDLALVVVAGVALWQLRLYGAPLTRDPSGTLAIDPLLVAAPAMGLVGGAVLALRIVPRIADLGEQVLVHGRGLVGAISGRQLARRPLRYTRAALLLVLASALGTLAAAHAETWTRSQAVQAAYRAAADVRAVGDDFAGLPIWAGGPLARAIPGVTAAVPVEARSLEVGRTVPKGTLAATDAVALARLLGSTDRADGGDARVLDLLAEAPTPAVVELPGDPLRIAVTIDGAFEVDPGVGRARPDGAALPQADAAVTISATLRDGDGRLFQTSAGTGAADALGARIVLAVDTLADGLSPSGPISLAALDIGLAAGEGVAISGTIAITGLAASDAASGEAGWTSLNVPAGLGGWAWSTTDPSQARVAYDPSAGHPARIDIVSTRPIEPSGTRTFRLYAVAPATVLSAVASTTFLEQTNARVGDEIGITSDAQPLRVRLVGSTPLFAPFDPATPFLIVDIASLDLVRYLETGRIRAADEWWMTVQPGTEASVVAALRRPDAGTSSVIGRNELSRALATDPVPLGLIGMLGLGGLAAVIFGGIGFLVNSTVSTSERVGEFSLMRALGLSTAQLGLWVSIENVFLLGVGLVAGTALGLLLAVLVLPFASMTQTGQAPIPAAEILVPWLAIVPIVLGAIGLLAVSLAIARRQLPDGRVTSVLRGRPS